MGLGRANRAREAAGWLTQMEQAGLNPNGPVYNWVVSACRRPPNPDLAEKVIRQMLANGIMPNDFCLQVARQILGGDRFLTLQAAMPQLRRAAAQVAREKKREEYASSNAKKGSGKGKPRDRRKSRKDPGERTAIMTPP
ncbi:unnamed protein product [Effrenium voratum]|nr:unnamed protein product [Effrenium voratum]